MPDPLRVTRLREVLAYDPDTGLFTWRKMLSGRARAGSIAGWTNGRGYVRITVDGVGHQAHRLAWLYVHGRWPSEELDHINGDRSDNRIANLREATKAQNQHNQHGASRNNRSGLLGAHSHRGKWRSSINLDGRRHLLGTFDTPEEAHSAYLVAKRRLHPFAVLGRV